MFMWCKPLIQWRRSNFVSRAWTNSNPQLYLPFSFSLQYQVGDGFIETS